MASFLGDAELSVLCAHLNVLDASWRIYDDMSSHARLYFIAAGTGTLRMFGETREFVPGYLYLIPPRSGCSFWTDSSVTIYWTHFTLDLASSLSAFAFLSDRVEYRKSVGDIAETTERFRRLIEARAGAPAAGKTFLAKGLLYLFLAEFFDFREEETYVDRARKRLYERLKPALDYIEKRRGERVEIAKLARLTHFERTYFTTLFTRLFNVSPNRYVLSRKIEWAKALLRDGDDKLESIATSLGFNDAFHFSKTFKRFTGKSPSQFRKDPFAIVP